MYVASIGRWAEMACRKILEALEWSFYDISTCELHVILSSEGLESDNDKCLCQTTKLVHGSGVALCTQPLLFQMNFHAIVINPLKSSSNY